MRNKLDKISAVFCIMVGVVTTVFVVVVLVVSPMDWSSKWHINIEWMLTLASLDIFIGGYFNNQANKRRTVYGRQHSRFN